MIYDNIREFLYAFSYDPRFFTNFPFLWEVTIDGVSPGSINSVLSEADEQWKARTSAMDMTRSGNILVAQSVSLPSESSDFTATEFGTGMGGYLPGYGLMARSNFLSRSFSVNFLETQLDIEHNFFRPWLIALSIQGLIEEGPPLKGTMTVKQYSNYGGLIKGFTFRKMFPTAVESYTLSYENTEFIVKSVTFGCENYAQI